MPNLSPLRYYAEHDVINLYAYSGSNNVNKGTLVKIVRGWSNDDILAYDAVNGATYQNTVSARYGVKPRITAVGSGETPIGMMLNDVREVDENGESLLYNPRKAAEMQAVTSGWAVPVVTKGVFLYSGVNGTPVGTGELAYVNNSATDGSISTTGTVAVGKFLGPKDSKGRVLVKLAL